MVIFLRILCFIVSISLCHAEIKEELPSFDRISKISDIDTTNIDEKTLILLDYDNTIIDKESTHLLDPSLPDFIRLLQEKGATVICFTSRSYDLIEKTRKELKKFDIDFSTVPLKNLKLPDRISFEKDGHDFVYPHFYSGMIFTNTRSTDDLLGGKEKGKTLKDFLIAIQESQGKGIYFSHIIVIDDKETELNSIFHHQTDYARLTPYHKGGTKNFQLTLYHLNTSFAKKLKSLTKIYGADEFPANLHNKEIKFLGHSEKGATGVDFFEYRGQRFTFKCLESADLMKEEILADAIYKAFGVPVPDFAIYTEPLVNTSCVGPPPYRVSKYIDHLPLQSLKDTEISQVFESLRNHFVLDAFLANWDGLAIGKKAENFLIAKDLKPFRIDNGGALRFKGDHALKERTLIDDKTGRTYDMRIVSDLDDLLNEKIADKTAPIYKGISKEQIQSQIEKLLEKKESLFQTIDFFNTLLKIKEVNDLKNILANRLKYLEEIVQGHQKIGDPYEKATNTSSASIFPYSLDEKGEQFFLFVKRRNENQSIKDNRLWCDLGGMSDITKDQILADTASREAFEESMGLINIPPMLITNSFSNDLISQTPEGMQRHRMYLIQTNLPPLLSFNTRFKHKILSDEKNASQTEIQGCALISATSLYNALRSNSSSVDVVEGIEWDKKGENLKKVSTIEMYDPLYQSLKQPTVLSALQMIISHKKIKGHFAADTKDALFRKEKSSLTADFFDDAYQERIYKSGTKEIVVDPSLQIKEKKMIESFMDVSLNKAKVLKELKEKSKPQMPFTTSPVISRSLSQTDGFLSLIMKGDLFQPQSIENISNFFKCYPLVISPSEKIRDFYKTLEDIYLEELKENKFFVFYHATDAATAFLFDLFTEFRNQISYEDTSDIRILRGWDEFFQNLENVGDFIKKSQEESRSKTIDNYAGNFQERGLSTNISLFGSYNQESSSSYSLFYKESSIAPPSFLKILKSFLFKIGASEDLRERIEAVFEKYASNSGRMLQIFINPDVVDQMVYFAYPGGKLLNEEGVKGLEPSFLLNLLKTNPQSFIKEIALRSTNFSTLSQLQARLFLHPKFMLNPNNVKIKSFWRFPLDEKTFQHYKHELSTIVKQIVASTLERHAAHKDILYEEESPLHKNYRHYFEAQTGTVYQKQESSHQVRNLMHLILNENEKELYEMIVENPSLLLTKFPEAYKGHGQSYESNEKKVFEVSIWDYVLSLKRKESETANVIFSFLIKFLKEHPAFSEIVTQLTADPSYGIWESLQKGTHFIYKDIDLRLLEQLIGFYQRTKQTGLAFCIKTLLNAKPEILTVDFINKHIFEFSQSDVAFILFSFYDAMVKNRSLLSQSTFDLILEKQHRDKGFNLLFYRILALILEKEPEILIEDHVKFFISIFKEKASPELLLLLKKCIEKRKDLISHKTFDQLVNDYEKKEIYHLAEVISESMSYKPDLISSSIFSSWIEKSAKTNNWKLSYLIEEAIKAKPQLLSQHLFNFLFDKLIATKNRELAYLVTHILERLPLYLTEEKLESIVDLYIKTKITPLLFFIEHVISHSPKTIPSRIRVKMKEYLDVPVESVYEQLTQKRLQNQLKKYGVVDSSSKESELLMKSVILNQ